MKKIKIIGLFLVFISLSLIIFIKYTNNQQEIFDNSLYITNKQKGLTQNIAKNVFYIYRNELISLEHLNQILEKFIFNKHLNNKIPKEIYSLDIRNQQNKITLLEDEFRKQIEVFKEQDKVVIAYANVLLKKSVNNIYHINLKLVQEFDKLILLKQKYYQSKAQQYAMIENIMIFILSFLFIYLFTQIKTIILFIQTFSDTSHRIIENSSIKDLKKIDIKNNNQEIQNAINNFNSIVEKINYSIEYSANQIAHTSKSLEIVEQNIEDFMDYCIDLDTSKKEDRDIIKKEDKVIESLDELMNLSNKLLNLEKNLKNLIKNA